jgi:hypothetical protein
MIVKHRTLTREQREEESSESYSVTDCPAWLFPSTLQVEIVEMDVKRTRRQAGLTTAGGGRPPSKNLVASLRGTPQPDR